MKRFIVSIMSYILSIFVIVFLLNSIYIRFFRIDNDYTLKYETIPEHIKICNVGSSHGLYGFNYSDIQDEMTCFNFGLSSQYPSYDYRLLSNYQDNLDEGATVFILVSYFTLTEVKDEDDPNFGSRNKRYYKILPKAYVKQYDLFTDIIVNKIPILNASSELHECLNSGNLGNTHQEWNQNADNIDLTYYVDRVYKKHIVNDKIDPDGNYILNAEEIDALYNIINLCHKNKWTPILITTPYLAEYTDMIKLNSPDYLELFYREVEQISSSTGAEYYDYSSDPRFANHHDLFMDGDHLNKEGARLFTNTLYQEILLSR